MKKIFFLLSGIVFLIMLACNTNKNSQSNIEESETMATSDSTKIQIDVTKIDSITLIITDEEKKTVVKNEDWQKLADYLSTARYDTAWNDKGIMVKMVAPDYTLIIQYKDKTPDQNDWLMLWKENGRTKFKDKWFFLAGDKMSPLYQLLENYRNSEK